MREINPYVDHFKIMREIWDAERKCTSWPKTEIDAAKNMPGGNEMAAVSVGEDSNPLSSVDFVVYDRNPDLNPYANMRRMQSTNRHADPMLYPLFSSYGEQGWATNVPHKGPRRTHVHKISP